MAKSVFEMNINYDIASKMGYFGGILIIILAALALLFVGVVRGYPTMTDFQILSIPLSLGIALFSIGIAMHSCRISEEAKKIAKDSDIKMKSIANVQFLQVVNMLEDARVYFIAGIYKTETYTWKTKNCIEMAVELLKRDKKEKYIESDYQDKLFRYFIMSFNHFFKDPNWKNETASINHLIESYAMLEDYYSDKWNEEFNTHLEDKLGKKGKKDFLKKVKETKETLALT